MSEWLCQALNLPKPGAFLLSNTALKWWSSQPLCHCSPTFFEHLPVLRATDSDGFVVNLFIQQTFECLLMLGLQQ